MCNIGGIYDEALSHCRWKTVLKKRLRFKRCIVFILPSRLSLGTVIRTTSMGSGAIVLPFNRGLSRTLDSLLF